MSDDQYEDESEETESPAIRNMRKRIKELEAEAKKANEAEARAAAAERRLAVTEAGIKLNPTQMKALASVHEGEWTPDALKATAADLGYIAPPEPEVPAEELEALNRVAEAANGGGMSASKAAEYEAAVAQAKNIEELLEVQRRFGVPISQDY